MFMFTYVCVSVCVYVCVRACVRACVYVYPPGQTEHVRH